MKKLKNPYCIFNNYLLRTPLYSLNYCNKWLNNETLAKDEFQIIFNNPIIKEAIYLASPILYNQLGKWFKNEITNTDKINRLQLSFLKYLTRLTTRCTPFGLFASCNIGRFSNTTHIELEKITKYKRITRFDMSFLVVLTNQLIKHKELREQLKFYPNTSLYPIGSQYRYVEYSIKDNKREFMLEGILHSSYIELILQEAKTGKTITHLASLLIDDDINNEDARAFINELIEKQLLVSELELTLTGKDTLDFIIAILKQKKGVNIITETLISFKNELKSIDNIYGNTTKKYEEIINRIKPIIPTVKNKHLFQTDLFSRTQFNTLDYKISKTLKQVMPLLNKITLPNENIDLKNFKNAFSQRYEDSEVPLTLVLDTETGIGYGVNREDNTPLIDNLEFDNIKKRFKNIKWRDIDSILQEKLIEGLSTNSHTITLKDIDFENFIEDWNDLPDTMSSLIEIVNDNGEERIIINAIGGSSSANLLARFGYGNLDLNNHIKEIITIENNINSTKLLAEIVHLPQARTGNILQRSVLRDYEIPYLANSCLDIENQIPIDDIMISVKKNRVYLRSIKHNKYIEPKLTNAHNFSYDALPVYHFLCDLQTQNLRSSIGFSWNSIFNKLPFLPRVEYRNCILSKAKWVVKTNTIFNLFNKTIDLEHISKWRKTINLPNKVELVEGDNTLLINFENIKSINMLFSIIKNKSAFILREFLFTEDGFVKHNDNSYCNQFIISFYNHQKLKNETTNR